MYLEAIGQQDRCTAMKPENEFNVLSLEIPMKLISISRTLWGRSGPVYLHLRDPQEALRIDSKLTDGPSRKARMLLK